MKIIYVFLFMLVVFAAIIYIFPIYWTITGSFRPLWDAMKEPPELFPSKLTLANYRRILFDTPAIRWAANSMIVASGVTVISVSTACMSGYAFAKKEFPLKNLIFWGLLATMMVPFHVTIIPLFITMRSLGLYDTHLAVILCTVLGTGFMFLARQYMSILPSELIDAAKVDGASELRIFVSVVMPLCKSLVAALSIFSFVGAWSMFFWPLIMTSTDKARTLAVGVVFLSEGAVGGMKNLGVMLAGAALISVPMYIIFICFQKYFTKGVTMGGVKG